MRKRIIKRNKKWADRKISVSPQNLSRRKQRKGIFKKTFPKLLKKHAKPVSCAEKKRFVKNCGLFAKEQVGDNKQKISPNLTKRTDFLVHKALFLVEVTGFEPAASTSQTLKDL